MRKSEIVMMPTRRCKRCGRLLYSKDAILRGYGSLCLRREREEMKGKTAEGQLSLWESEE